MKKKIAIWLFKLARRLYPISVTVFEQKEILDQRYVPRLIVSTRITFATTRETIMSSP
jgi:hypothetical protein